MSEYTVNHSSHDVHRYRIIAGDGTINKWGYAILAGVIALAYGEAPGGLSGISSFAIAFGGVFAFISALEIGYLWRRKAKSSSDEQAY